jgi:hypothetical protein
MYLHSGKILVVLYGNNSWTHDWITFKTLAKDEDAMNVVDYSEATTHYLAD